MHPRVLGMRSGKADTRLRAVVEHLCGEDAAARLEAVHDRDPQVKALLQREAVVDLLEEMHREKEAERMVEDGEGDAPPLPPRRGPGRPRKELVP